MMRAVVTKQPSLKAQRIARWLQESADARCARRISLMSESSTTDSELSARSETNPETSSCRSARAARWELITDAWNERGTRDGYYGNPPSSAPTSSRGRECETTEFPWQGLQPAHVTTRRTSHGTETELFLGGTMSCKSTTSSAANGAKENMVLVSHLDERGAAEVVYRRLTIDRGEAGGGEVISESGSATATVGLLKSFAAKFGTSAPALLRSFADVPEAESVLSASLPADFAAASRGRGVDSVWSSTI